MDKELRDSIKDQAELNMIVDLERNDLGRVCEISTVKVGEARTIEAHPTVYHGVATIEGLLRPEVGFVDILRAMFPGGSITGARRRFARCKSSRGWNPCGARALLRHRSAISPRMDSMEFNIAIRTMIVKDCQVHIPVGGGSNT